MSQTYEERLSSVERVLVAENVDPGPGKTLTGLAGKVLAALDGIKEVVR